MPLQVQLESVKLVNMFVFVLLVLIVSFEMRRGSRSFFESIENRGILYLENH